MSPSWPAFLKSAHGQNLTNLQGLTELQQPTATAVQTVCAKFTSSPATGGPTYDPNNPKTPADQLFASCRVMVQTANAVNTNPSPPDPGQHGQ